MTSSVPDVLSAKNPQLKRLRRLASRSRSRGEEDVVLIEGPTLVVEAFSARLNIEAVYAEVSAEIPTELVELDVRRVADGVLAGVLSTENPQPVAAVAARPHWSMDDLRLDRPVLVLAEVRDPGNLGSLWRSAEAGGCAGVVVVGSTVDATNPKVIRASAGAAFRLPLVEFDDLAGAASALHVQGRQVLATMVERSFTSLDSIDLASAAIVLGNEARGLSHEELAVCDGGLHIPMAGPTESLGVAAAGAVVAFEAWRRRRQELDNENPLPDAEHDDMLRQHEPGTTDPCESTR